MYLFIGKWSMNDDDDDDDDDGGGNDDDDDDEDDDEDDDAFRRWQGHNCNKYKQLQSSRLGVVAIQPRDFNVPCNRPALC